MTEYSPRWTRCIWLAISIACLLVLLWGSVCTAYTQGDPEFRAFWVDAWHNGALSQSQVDQLLGVVGNGSSKGDIRNANFNAVIVQVRRNCDVCYPSSMGEPYMSGLSPADFNSLQAVIAAAHDTTGGKKRIEVHAWIVTFRTSGGLVYAQHNNPADPANYWVSLDNSGREVSDRGLDPGHPNCEQYTVDVVMDIVNNFDVDGVHFDYIRFTANNQGYNPTSIARYNARYGLTGQPAPDEEQFKQWRRDQVSQVVRKVYAKVQATKPAVKVSGSFVTWNNSPRSSTRDGFMATRPYYDVYSDWDSWLQEGIVDMAVPMTYYDNASLPADYVRWMNFEKDRHGSRHMVIGPGLYMNYLDDAISELQATRDPSPAGNYADGFCGYSYWAPYVAIKSSSPTYGSWSTFSSRLLTDLTPTWADVPTMPWKVSPTKGHISGTVTHSPVGIWADGATVSLTGTEERSMLTDGTGFYAFIDLLPGPYTITVSMPGCVTTQRQVNVGIGSVTGNMYVVDIPIITAPFITNVRATDIGTNSATIGWETDQPASAQVQYGLTTGYGSMSALDPTALAVHSMTLTGLNPNSVYHYRVISANVNGSRTSGDYTFTTGSYMLTLIANPTDGGSCTGGGWCVPGAPMLASASAKSGYTFKSWSTNPDGTSVVSTASQYYFNMPFAPYTLYANFVAGVPDIIIESEVGGQNSDWYFENGMAHSSAKSTAAGITAGIGSRYGSTGADIETRYASYEPAIAVDGFYQVFATWGTSSSGGSNVLHSVGYLDGEYTKSFSQYSGAGLQNKWNSIGTFPFAIGESGECGYLVQWVDTLQASKRIMADAAKWVYVGPFQAVNPTPADGAVDVSAVSPILSWEAGGTTAAYDVYIGTSPTTMVKVSSAQTGTTYTPELSNSTIYYWRVDSIAFNKTTTGATWMFTTSAIPPIILSAPVSTATTTTATITWATDQLTTSQVLYGATYTYGQSTTDDTNLVASHSVTITGLTPNTVYHYKVKSTSAMGLSVYSNDATFATLPTPLSIVVDNPQGTKTGTWTALTDAGGWPVDASQYVYANNTMSTTTATYIWTPNILIAGKYNVYCWYKSGLDRTTSARFTVNYSGGQLLTTVMNQQLTGSTWALLASGKQFNAGTTGYVELTNKTGETDSTKKVVADAIMFEYAESDSTPPTVPTNVVATATSTSQINLTWTASTDAYGIMGYRVYRDSQIVGITTSTSFSDIGLAANTRYTYTVSACDPSNNESAKSTGKSRYTLARTVSAADVTCDRTAATWYNTAPFKFTNDGFGASKLTSYRYVWDTSASHTWTDTETSLTTSSTTQNATSGTAGWYIHLKGYNGDGVSCGTLNMGPYKYDGTSPSVTITAPWYLQVQGSSYADLSAIWNGTDSASGVAEYQYAIGTSAGGTNVKGWTSAGTATTASYRDASALSRNYSYYWSVKCKDQAGNWSSVVTADPTMYARTYTSLASALANLDGTAVWIDSYETVTGVFATWCYIQEPARSFGLKVDTLTTSPAGSTLKLAGILAGTTSERSLSRPYIISTGSSTTPSPIFMRAASLGGQSPNVYTHGQSGAIGLYNIGLLVRVAGKVASHGSGFFVLDDGSGATVKVYSSKTVADGNTVGVTGVCTSETGARVLRTRSTSDVVIYSP